MRAVAGGLDHAPKIKWRKNQKALARANGTFRRASGWSGEKVARSGSRSSQPSREWVSVNRECGLFVCPTTTVSHRSKQAEQANVLLQDLTQYCSFSVKSQMVAAPLTAWAPAKLGCNVLPGWGGGDAHSWGTASGGVSPCEAATGCGYWRNVRWRPHGAHQRTIGFAPATALGGKAPERGWVRRTSRTFPVKDKLRCVTPCVSAARCISQQIA